MSTEDATHLERASLLLLADDKTVWGNELSCFSSGRYLGGGIVKQRMIACGKKRRAVLWGMRVGYSR